MGFVSHDAEGNRLRVRDRSEILPAEPGEEPAPETYEVTVAVASGSFEGAETAAEGQDYTGKIVAADGYQLPEQITVTVAGQELNAGDYTYDAQTGELTIPGEAVTGKIEISRRRAAISREQMSREQTSRAMISREQMYREQTSRAADSRAEIRRPEAVRPETVRSRADQQ